MSVIVILDGPKNQPKCESRLVRIGQGQVREENFLNDVSVDIKADGVHVYLAYKLDEAKPSTAFDADSILGYSVQDYVKTTIMRAPGRYRFGSAEITVDELSSHGTQSVPGYQIIGFARKLEDLQELYRLIRSGEIAPYRSYAGPQIGPIAGRLRRVVENVKGYLRRLNHDWTGRQPKVNA